MEKVQIMSTISPVTGDKEIIRKMIEAGMDAVRINFSHGDFESNGEVFKNIIDARKELGRDDIIIMQDLCGPKIRTGELQSKTVFLKEGDNLTLTTEKIDGDSRRMSVSYPKLPEEVKVGENILLNDGKQSLKVKEIRDNEIYCEILVGGEIYSRRGVNLPDTDLMISALTEKDKKDLQFTFDNPEIEYVTLSFVQRKIDIEELRDSLEENNCKAKIIAKIETPTGVKNFDEILEVSDAIMIGRGDMAVEVGFEKIPAIQKMMIKKCNKIGIPVIVATQMLSSMSESKYPTRAEVSDVANAVFDGANLVMTSEETAMGKHPILVVETMQKIIDEAEKFVERKESYKL